jgi:hypothetical protein
MFPTTKRSSLRSLHKQDYSILSCIKYIRGTEALRYKLEVRGFDYKVSFEFFTDLHYGTGVDSASNRNEYQE